MSNIIGNGGVTLRGTKPGSPKAVRQHQAMAQGYQVAGDRPYKNDLMKQEKTGGAFIPSGLGRTPDR